MKKLPIGIQTFSKLITENYIYVDKTDIIYDLISSGKYYFLSRPRRFGKSLFISTLESLFSNEKELFENLAISRLTYEWKKYPIIKISFASLDHASPEDLKNSLKLHLHNVANSYNITLNRSLSPSQMLQQMVITLSQKENVVLLIDEYDYPILSHLHKTVLAEQMREVLKNFYGVIKDLDPHLRFVLLTGISKFASTSIFSGLNNLQDISLNYDTATLTGYTEEEIKLFFPDHLNHASTLLSITPDDLMNKMRLWYNGYRFAAGFPTLTPQNVYNPFSVLSFLKEVRFSNYWFKTGTPTFLINLLKERHYPIQDFEKVEASEIQLNSFEIETIQLKVLLFLTGYLTIKNYIPESGNYVLTFPNKEATLAFREGLL